MDKKRNWFGLSTEKDGPYAYLMVASSAWMSTFIYGYNVTCSLLTGLKLGKKIYWKYSQKLYRVKIYLSYLEGEFGIRIRNSINSSNASIDMQIFINHFNLL